MRVSLGSEVISMMQLNKVSDGYDVSSREARLICFLTSKIFQCFLILPCKTFEGFKKILLGAGEMAQWLKILAGPPQGLGSIPSTHMAIHTCL